MSIERIRRWLPRVLTVLLLACGGALSPVARSVQAQQRDPLTEPFRGITTTGTIQPNLFPIRATGVTTAPVRVAAERFLAGLSAPERERTVFAVDADEWRRWNNVHRATRAGISFAAMTAAQRTLGLELLRASLSAKGLEKSRNIMRLNGHIADVLDNHTEYGEHLYNLVVLGEPSATAPWGWQLEGHHLIINYFILGDQVVMTPTFMGSEPVTAETGRFAGTRVLQEEQDMGLAMILSLTAEQRSVAVLQPAKTANVGLAHAYRDNVTLEYAGIRADALTAAQRTQLLELIGEYVHNMSEGHALIRMAEARAHLDQTHFAWIGETGPASVFYYRIQSPVILIEFDHQSPVALPGPRVPGRAHIHTVVRTPNGNDYGKDLLRQHYEAHRNDEAHGHHH